jgi:hypothetical protein
MTTTPNDLNTLLNRVASITAKPPREEAILAIRTLEATLVAALDGETLRDLPNLGTGMSPFAGANVRGGRTEARIAFPRDGQDMGTPSLVLRPDGRLAVAWTIRNAERGNVFDFTHRGADDDDLRVEDLGALLVLLPKVLTNHLAKAEKLQTSFGQIRDLAHRVLDLLPRRAG